MICEYTLTSANAVRKPHTGLVVNAWYKRDPLDQNERPIKIVVFNRWPKVKMKLDCVEYPIQGVYVKR
jgi:hypothetical protein